MAAEKTAAHAAKWQDPAPPAREGAAAQQKGNEGIAAYVGISAPETPKYLLTNNFLADYFETAAQAQNYDFRSFQAREVLYTEDQANEEKLKHSFDLFLQRYLGEEVIREENRGLKDSSRHFYFPLIPEMLTDSTATLRHVLYHLQMADRKFDFYDMQKKLDRYIFEDVSGLNYILKILFQSGGHKTGYKKPEKAETVAEYWSMLTRAEWNRMTRLGQRLNEDLDRLLTHPYFLHLDFYRRYHYLSMLLTSYVIQYILVRKDGSTGILCKGNPLDSRLGGTLHRACCNNYDDIRALFPSLLKNCYENATRRLAGEKEDLEIMGGEGKVTVNGRDFQDFTADMTGRRTSNRIEYEKIMRAFELEEKVGKHVPAEEFVLRYIDLTKTRRGSTLTKLSSTLSTSGRQIGMIYPRSNARQKYFAMSENLAEFYVRLYLARQGRQYDYLDTFLDDLQDRYRIVIAKSAEGDKKLRSVRPRLSAQDLAKNKEALIDTLSSVNCLIKLSDSGYVVTLPEMKGDFRLI